MNKYKLLVEEPGLTLSSPRPPSFPKEKMKRVNDNSNLLPLKLKPRVLEEDSMFFENSVVRKRSLWTVNEVASYLSVSTRTVRDWVYRKVIPYRKVGKNLRFHPHEIERWTLQH